MASGQGTSRRGATCDKLGIPCTSWITGRVAFVGSRAQVSVLPSRNWTPAGIGPCRPPETAEHSTLDTSTGERSTRQLQSRPSINVLDARILTKVGWRRSCWVSCHRSVLAPDSAARINPTDNVVPKKGKGKERKSKITLILSNRTSSNTILPFKSRPHAPKAHLRLATLFFFEPRSNLLNFLTSTLQLAASPSRFFSIPKGFPNFADFDSTRLCRAASCLFPQTAFHSRFPFGVWYRHPVIRDTTLPNPAERPSTPASSQLSQRTLRRTSRFEATPSPTPQPARQVHIEVASVGFSPKPQLATAPAPAQTLAPAPILTFDYPRIVAPQDRRHSRTRRVLSQDLSEVDFDQESSDEALQYRDPTSPSAHSRRESHRPHRVSRNTRGAILFALEEALRQPHPFTPDEVEESASMADLIGGGAAASNGNASTSTRHRPTGAPNPTSSPSGIRGPRMIMQERAAREAARQRAEQEQMQLERQRAEQEARLLEDTQRRNAERRAAAAAAAAAAATGAAGGGSTGGAANVPQQDPPTSHRRPVATDAPQARTNPGGSSRQPTTSQTHARPGRTASISQPGQQPYTTAPQAGTAQQQPNTSIQGGQESGAAASRPRNSFPHAFERWETLSAHWEGLTSFWIRRLEQNNQDIERDPINQALSRQVTDLTAAGANLFHAVVELQRLRASSERKFQRWFFETRAELERAQEVNAMLEAALEEERRARENAVQAAIQKERQHSANDERVKEMKKELQISKEEARRAWEELGRREHEERERTLSLQSGQPTIVGGVQVVPMTQGVPSRHGSSREQYSGQQSGYAGEYSQAASGQPAAAGSNSMYQSSEAGQEGVTYTGTGSEGGYSEGEYAIDAQGQFIRDSQGNKVPFIAPPSPVSDEGTEEYETPATNPPSAGYAQTPTTAGEQQQQPYTGQDYSGSGYAAPGWETVPRHHHPTRLSDVMEEDERSRASNSQVGGRH
ncbi:hypothetical protein LZ30DRAFT_693018 [Colletotrichum cereale]|nr:hypothetical protein LZ30DRAFT_693018 [Colletotrichum cereale]